MEINYDNWTIVKRLGTGSFGSVYEIQREDFGVYKAALKVISIPQMPEEVNDIRSSGMSDQSISDYYNSMAKEIVNEFALMSKLKGMTNIVSYEDHRVIPHEGGIGFDIYIRMELVTPLDKYILDHQLDEKGIARLGIELCRALERCQRLSIIHRDIKPANIFISEQGDFKLGDFGISRTLDRTASNLSRKGTTNYMAPEVYNGNEYGPTVDIYSLGLVMYRLLNHNRMPFLPSFPNPISFQDQEMAHIKRVNGTPLPYPNNEKTPLGDVILKACAFESKDRFQTPSAFRHALERITENSRDLDDNLKNDIDSASRTMSVESRSSSGTNKEVGSLASVRDVKNKHKEANPRKNNRKMILVLAAVAVLIVVILLIVLLPKSNNSATEQLQNNPLSASSISIANYVGENALSVQEELQKAGLSVILEEKDGVSDQGTVLEQSLPSGSTANKGDTLLLTVSNGNLVPIPAFYDLPQKEVTKQLEKIGLKVKTKVLDFVDGVSAGNVTKLDFPESSEETENSTETQNTTKKQTELKEGDLVNKNSSLIVFVCGIKMPPVIGMQEAAAAQTLTALGLRVASSGYQNSDSVAAGSVISVLDKNGNIVTDGDILKQNAPLSLIISAGPYVTPDPGQGYTQPVYQEPTTAAAPADTTW